VHLYRRQVQNHGKLLTMTVQFYLCPVQSHGKHPKELGKKGGVVLPASSSKPRKGHKKLAKKVGAVIPASSSKAWKVPKKTVSAVWLDDIANSSKAIGAVSLSSMLFCLKLHQLAPCGLLEGSRIGPL
jgi:hypothetical protein